MMMNLELIERQPHWRVWVVAWFSRMMGVVVHVEGIPFGSARSRKPRTQNEIKMGAAQAGQIGGPPLINPDSPKVWTTAENQVMPIT